MDAHEADLALAAAAARGEPDAVRQVVEQVLPAIAPAVRRIDPSPAFLDEVRQALEVRLLVGDGEGAPPRIAGYRGEGPLTAWVRAAAVRLALNLKRAGRREVPADEVLEPVLAAGAAADPELRHLTTLYRAELGAAIQGALAALPDRDRVLLRLHFVDGVRLARLGALYQVTESTASRWVRRALDAVGEEVRARLRARLALSSETFESIVRLVQSQLDVSIRGLLAGDGGPARDP